MSTFMDCPEEARRHLFSAPFPDTCRICGKGVRSRSGLGSHLKNQHPGITYVAYFLQYYQIDLDALARKWMDEAPLRHDRMIKAPREKNKRPPKERMTKEQYKRWRESMSQVQTLPWFIQKYGEEEGKKKYEQRSLFYKEKYPTSGFRKSTTLNRATFSKMSQLLFDSITQNRPSDKVYYATKNHEHSAHTQYRFDFVDEATKKVIEFNGDRWHANPQRFKATDCPNPHYPQLTAEQIWEQDKQKTQAAKNKGYQVLIVWEAEYKRNPSKVLGDCLLFLREEIRAENQISAS